MNGRIAWHPKRCAGWAYAALCLLACHSGPANAAGDGLFSSDNLEVHGDIRLVGADGEKSWIDGGFGKARFGGTKDGDVRVRPEAVEGALIWRPNFTWSLGGTVVAVAQQGQDHPIDLSEAFLSFKPAARENGTRMQARAGLFWPPVSLEHSGAAWSVTETITPSAINSWIGEEVKMIGAEGSATLPVGGGRVSLTAATFLYNTTAGALLAFRGWALHDQKAVAFGRQKLPPLSNFIQAVQPPYSRPVLEIGKRPGFYAQLAWSPPAPFRIEVLHYDNRGDPESVNDALEWGWDTRFDNLSIAAKPATSLEIRAQALAGRTRMGFPDPTLIWVDTRFRSAYLMATRHFGRASLSGRIEAFDTRNRGSQVVAEDDEDGWAATVAGRHPLTDNLTLLVELLHVESERGARHRAGLPPRQDQSVFQLALRAHF